MTNSRILIIVSVIAALVMFFGSAKMLTGFSPIQTITFFRARTLTDLECSGQTIADALLNYRNEHGDFPEALQQVDAGDTSTLLAPWMYSVSDDRQSCTLTVGDYGRCSFVIWWTDTDGWYFDT